MLETLKVGNIHEGTKQRYSAVLNKVILQLQMRHFNIFLCFYRHCLMPIIMHDENTFKSNIINKN